jgi:hypothetical protein
MGKHYGAFAKGFSDSLIAMMRLSMTRDLYEARMRYYDARGYAAMHRGGVPPDVQNAMDKEKAAWGTGGGGAGGGGGGGTPGHFADKDLDAYFSKAAAARGIDENVARQVVNQESGMNPTERTGDGGSSFGPLQFHFGGMNPNMPNAGMGDDFLKATGIDIRRPGVMDDSAVQRKMIDFGLDRAAQKGWGDWATTRDKLKLGNMTGIGGARATETAGAPTKGPNKGKTPTADVPTKMATAEAEETAAPGGGFKIPGEPAAPEPWHVGGTPSGPVTIDAPHDPQNLMRDPAQIAEQARAGQAVTPPPPPSRPTVPVARPPDVNQPSPDATPVSATHAIPSAPAQDPRFTQVAAPNADPTARNRPQTTALDLSHLWGPNPPVADRAPAPPGPPPPVAVRPQEMDWQGVASAPDMTNVSFSAKGGPVTQRVSLAKGGAIPARPTMKFYGGGTAPASSQYPTYTQATPTQTPQQIQQGRNQAAAQYMLSLPGAQQFDPTARQPTFGGPMVSNFTAMTPDQQKQYSQMVAGTWQPPAATPAAAPAAAAPAPAPIINPPSVQNITTYQGTPGDPSGVNAIDPTSTTTTGTPGVPTTGLQAATYDPNKIATTGTGSATDASGATNYSVDPKDQTKQILSAKGGAIPAKPITRFAGGASAVTAAMNAPNYVGPTLQGGWSGTPYAQLAPNQQTWANTQRGLLGQELSAAGQDAAYWRGGGQSPTGVNDTMQYWNQMTTMPDAIWPTVAPAAPTPLNEPGPSAQNITAPQTDITTIDPTSTTTTGTPGVPTTGLQAATYDPNKIATTGTGSATDATGSTNYSVDPKDQTKQILSRKGGPITRRVSRYDDGGGVSPSIAGAPPGATGGAGAIPPIYYNPATYAAAGAPVGKGVSANSAPTFGAGAIPSLPMARGGSVAFDDGGDVSGYDPTMQAMDLADARDDAATPAAPQGPMTSAEPGFYVMPDQAATSADHNTPPPDPTTPQIKDDQGNPSRGLIGAISDGLHWLGDHLGLVGGAQAAQPAIAQNPQTQDKRQKFVGNHPDGDTYWTHQNNEELKKYADPGGQLNDAYRNIAALEAGYKFALSKGDDATASRLAASMLHYSVLTSQNLSAEAAKALYNGDLQGSVDKLNQASDALPDGRLVHATLNPDGKTVTITGSDLNGQTLWQQHGAAQTILEHATALGRSGKLQWDALESQAAKYDSTFAEMAKARNMNATQAAQERRQQATWEHQQDRQQQMWEHQQDVLDQRQKAKEDAATASEERVNKAFAPQTQAIPPAPVTPRVTPVEASAAPASGGTPAAAPPPTSDENQGQGPTVASATGLPPQPTQADLPATDEQAVEQYQRRYNLVADQVIKQVGAEPQPPAPPDWSQLKPKDYPAATARHNSDIKNYTERHDAWQKRVNEGIAGEMKDIGAERSTQAAATLADKTAQRQLDEQKRAQTFTEQAPLTTIQRQDIYKGTNPMEATASLPRYAVYDNKGQIDPNASAQALGRAYDIPPSPGAAATGGLQRATTVANVAEDAATYNTHMSLGNVHDLVDGLARGVYTIEGKPTPVTRHDEQLDQFIVHQQQGDPGVTLYLPKQSGYQIARIRKEFEDAKPKAAGALPPAPRAPAFPGATSGAPPPSGGFNMPPPPPNPRAQWWINQALGRGRSPAPFGQSPQ